MSAISRLPQEAGPGLNVFAPKGYHSAFQNTVARVPAMTSSDFNHRGFAKPLREHASQHTHLQRKCVIAQLHIAAYQQTCDDNRPPKKEGINLQIKNQQTVALSLAVILPSLTQVPTAIANARPPTVEHNVNGDLSFGT